MSIRHLATRLHDSGYNVIPLKEDSTPLVANWTKSKVLRTSLERSSYYSIGISPSCSESIFECIDFDLKHDKFKRCYQDFLQLIEEYNLQEVFSKCYVEETRNKGYHVIYRLPRVPESDSGNRKLASREGSNEAMIETRGQGGYVIVAPSPKYEKLQNDLFELKEITISERNLLIHICKELNEVEEVAKTIKLKPSNVTTIPALDDKFVNFNNHRTLEEVVEIWLGLGCTIHSQTKRGVHLTRPNKDVRDGLSISVLNPTGENPVVMSYNFSSSLIDVPLNRALNPCDVLRLTTTTSTNEELSKAIDEFNFLNNIEEKKLEPIRPVIGSSWKKDDKDEEQIFVEDLPRVSDELIDEAPDIIKRIVNLAGNKGEREVAYLSALTTLSGVISNTSILHYNKTYHPNLMTYIMGPASSGKGVMEDSIRVIEHVQDWYEDQVEQDLMQLEEDEEEVDTTRKIVVCEANMSKAIILKKMEINDGLMMLHATEADTLIGSLNQEWGNFSDVLRKSFHHEASSSARKTDDEFIRIKVPKISFALSSTYNQFKRFIKDEENGTFSRFLYYHTPRDRVIKPGMLTPKPKAHEIITKDDLIREIGDQASQLFKHLGMPDREQVLYYNEFDSKRFEKFFQERKDEIYNVFENVSLDSVSHRLPIIVQRIALVHEVLNNFDFEKNQLRGERTISTRSMEIAMELADILVRHSVRAYEHLAGVHDTRGEKEEELLKKMQDFFDTKTAHIVGKELLGLSTRTVNRYLSKLVEWGMIKRLTKGTYGKSNKVKL